MTPALTTNLNEIGKLLDAARPQVVVVVGAGVAINATGQPHASWLGLLKHGIRHLVAIGRLNESYGDSLESSLSASFSPFQLQEALKYADVVEKLLNLPDEKAFAQWLEATFAQFVARDDQRAKSPLDVLRDLHAAGALLLTTNYDGLLSDITGVPPVTWEEHADFHRVVTRRQAGILHIHGHWRRPSSIVLGGASYGRVVADDNFQELFRSLWLKWSWIYVGCGDGLADPNLGRLLEWSKRWGRSALPDFFLAREDKAKEMLARVDNPTNLAIIGYPSHDKLPDVLRSVTPAARCWPFIRVDGGFPLFHVPGANDPFPTRQEYFDGDVPALAADVELLERLQTHGWACCVDVASVGKTTFALRAATAPEQRVHPVFYLDLKKEIQDDPDASPIAAVHRLARSGTLLILDNIHHQPQLARQIWDQWNAKPRESRGRLLLVGTRVHQLVVVSPEHDLRFFERHSANPAILLQPTPSDLGRLAKHLYHRRTAGARCAPMPEPPAEALAEWHSVYRAALNAFTLAVLDSLADFQKNKWPLPPSRASAWVRKHWLEKLDGPELENTICLAVFGAQELEILVQDDALPHPGKMDKLLELGLVAETRRGQLKQYRQFELREPGWGRLILAAVTVPVDEQQVLFSTASRALATTIVLSARLRRDADVRLKSLWEYLRPRAERLVSQVSDLPLSIFPSLVRLAKAAGQSELAAAFWNTIEADRDAFVKTARANSLDTVGSFLGAAKAQERDTAPLWDALLGKPGEIDHPAKLDEFVKAARTTSLENVGSFLDVAKEHDRDTAPLWDALIGKPGEIDRAKLDKFVEAARATSLDNVASFLGVAKEHARDTAPLWDALLGKPGEIDRAKLDKFVEAARATSLEKVGSFLGVAKAHNRDTAPLWSALLAKPGEMDHPAKLNEFVEAARAASLDKVGSFLGVAKAHQRDTAPLWDALLGKRGEIDQAKLDKFVEAARESSLDKVGSFLGVAKAHQRDTAPLWDALIGKPGDRDHSAKLDQFVKAAKATSLENVGSFLGVAKEHDRDTAPLWDALIGKPGDRDHSAKLDQFVKAARATSLEKVASFLGVAKEHDRDTAPLWDALIGMPGEPGARDLPPKLVEFVKAAEAASLDMVASFLGVAKEHDRDTGPLWKILGSEPNSLSQKGQTATLEALVTFARHAPISLLEIVLREIRPGHWLSTPASKGLPGATWLAWQCGKANRDDLVSDLLTVLLSRANWRDFPPQSGGFSQVCWLLANVPPSAGKLVDSFISAICTDQWLRTAYAANRPGQLAAGLRQLSMHQPVGRCRQFHHRRLGARLNEELIRFETAPIDRPQIIQLLGCAGLCGWAVSQRSLATISLGTLSELPLSVLRHRPEAVKIEDYQMQLWLGLRAFVSITRKGLSLPREAILETLNLWEVNLAETSAAPAAVPHRVNQSMVAWLDVCSHATPPALIPSTERLWTLVGFPARPVNGSSSENGEPRRARGARPY
jgi:hypothetical protein